jgi:endonuclease/exonuclease/phosphatase (EEP) superfamily protein YafD
MNDQRLTRSLAALIALSAVTGCSTYELATDWRADATTVIQTEPESCSKQLGDNSASSFDELNSADIRIVNWNIQKGGDPDWLVDLTTFTGEPDLMIFQEASLNEAAWGDIATDHYRSFAPGHRTRRSLTGVITLSSAMPLTQCNLVSLEPWLRSPKATVITEYGLTDTDQTLLVVNIHAINFTFGISAFREQIERALFVMNGHAGPILLSGDFNTWHARQSTVLHGMTERLGLKMLDYEEDFRKRAFGQPLDHIYVRGLQVITATTSVAKSSDHNPMSARLSL